MPLLIIIRTLHGVHTHTHTHTQVIQVLVMMKLSKLLAMLTFMNVY